MNKICPKCSGAMEAGVGTAYGLLAGAPKSEPRLIFTICGTPTSRNPVTALQQGLADEPGDATFWIKGLRCSECGFLELFAVDNAGV